MGGCGGAPGGVWGPLHNPACVRRHRGRTASALVPVLLAVPCSGTTTAWPRALGRFACGPPPLLLAWCGVTAPHQHCATLKWDASSRGGPEAGAPSLQASCQALGCSGDPPQPTPPGHASPARPQGRQRQAGPAFARDCHSIPVPPLASAFLRPRTPSLPPRSTSCLPGASPRPESPHGLCR